MAYYITENCIICGTCWEICPTESIEEYNWYYKITDTCVGCGACARVCPNAAIIKHNVRIGARSVIFPGVTLAKGCRIGAGSVVTKSTEPYKTYKGVPAHG